MGFSQNKICIVLTVLLVVGACLFIPFAQAKKTRVLVLMSHDAKPYDEALAGFRKCLLAKGIHAEFEVHYLRGDALSAPQVIRGIDKSGIDIVYTLGALATDTALENIVDRPIIAGLVLRAQKLRKAPNATGVELSFPIEIQFQWLQRFLPEARTIGVIYNPEENREKIDEARRIARTMGLKLEASAIQAPKELPLALKNVVKDCDVFWGIPDKLVFTPQTAKQILLHSFRNRVPFIGLSSAWVKAGALYSLEWDYRDIGKQCCEMALKVLQGTDIRSVPIASPRKVRYSLNLKTGEHMKANFSGEMVKKAYKVY